MNDEQFRRIMSGSIFKLLSRLFPNSNNKDYQNQKIKRGKEKTPASFRQSEQEDINSQYRNYTPDDIPIEPLEKRGYCFYDFLKKLLYTISRTFRHMRIIPKKGAVKNGVTLNTK